MPTHATDSIAMLSFEECYERLEQVISSLEAGELELERSIALYEEGMLLAQSCGQKLDAAQIKVTQLLSAAGDDADADALDVAEDAEDDASGPAKRQTTYLTT